jgi:hypothetical protein
LDRGNLASLMLLDLSAALYTIDHATLVRRFEVSCVTRGSDLIAGSSLILSIVVPSTSILGQPVHGQPDNVLHGVLQGLILGHILFLLNSAGLIGVTEGRGLLPHHQADDTQLYGFCSVSS